MPDSLGTMVCSACGHLRVMHPEGDRCRTRGCECEGFVLPEPTAEPEKPEPRRMWIDVPDGYTVLIRFVRDDGAVFDRVEPEPPDAE